MDAGSLFFLLAILLVVLIVITQPFYRPAATQQAGANQGNDGTGDDPEYQSILRAIRELNADYEQGKLNEADHAAQRALLEDQAIQRLQLKELTLSDAATATPDVEREIEQMIQSRRMTREEQTAGFCPRCGKPVKKSDQFCPSCGEPTRKYL
jgi:rubrerythrin